ncbi:hypothetical protein JCM10295v2_001918 [Rhodotorula toruloides]
MPLPPLETTSSADWQYTAEGGANLVVSFAGPAGSPFSDYALRLRKRKKRAGGGKGGEDTVPSEVDVEFGSRVIAPLVGQTNVVEMAKVRLSRNWLEELAVDMRAKGVRPAERESVDEVDLDAPEGVVVEDLIAGRGVLAVEIKPKWGFLPSPSHLSPSSAPVKTTYCRTCMHRHYKASQDDALDGFCPLDLYSGDSARVHKALEQLYGTWISSVSEINNLRIFLDGKRILPGDVSSAALPPATASLFAHALARTLLHSPALRLLRDLQSLLDVLDIEGLAALLSRSTGVDLAAKFGPEEVEKLGGQPRLEEWVEWVGRYAPVFGRRGEGQPTLQNREEWDRAKATLESRFLASSPPEQPPTPPWRDAILAYLLSAIFKDCSLIIRFPLDSSVPKTIGTVKAIDLDPKPIQRLGKYFRMDREIVECWKGRMERLDQEGRASEVRKCSDG